MGSKGYIVGKLEVNNMKTDSYGNGVFETGIGIVLVIESNVMDMYGHCADVEVLVRMVTRDKKIRNFKMR